MLARRSLNNQSRSFLRQAASYFSSKNEQATKEEIEQGRAEWGLKYDDECLKFEKEWKIISDRVNSEQNIYIEKELSDLQRKKVDMIADKLLDFNVFEHRYLAASISLRLERTSGINPLKLNMDWPSVK